MTITTKVTAALALAAALTALSGCSDEPEHPYTYRELVNADVECDAEALGEALNGTSSPNEAREDVEGGFSSTDVDCLGDKLPELTDAQLDDWSDYVEEVQAAELDAKYD